MVLQLIFSKVRCLFFVICLEESFRAYCSLGNYWKVFLCCFGMLKESCTFLSICHSNFNYITLSLSPLSLMVDDRYASGMDYWICPFFTCWQNINFSRTTFLELKILNTCPQVSQLNSCKHFILLEFLVC